MVVIVMVAMEQRGSEKVPLRKAELRPEVPHILARLARGGWRETRENERREGGGVHGHTGCPAPSACLDLGEDVGRVQGLGKGGEHGLDRCLQLPLLELLARRLGSPWIGSPWIGSP